MKTSKTVVLCVLFSLSSALFLFASPAKASGHSYNKVKRNFQPFYSTLTKKCSTSNSYFRRKDCAALAAQVNLSPLGRNAKVFTDIVENDAIAIGMEYQVTRAAAVRLYQVFEYENEVHYRTPRFKRDYFAVEYKDKRSKTWQTLIGIIES